MKVVVTGSRHETDRKYVWGELARIHEQTPITRLAHGNAPGVDRLAADWARSVGLHPEAYSANWDGLGKIAGHCRNAFMLRRELPDLVVAFPGGSGTADCIGQAKALGLRVHVVGGDA